MFKLKRTVKTVGSDLFLISVLRYKRQTPNPYVCLTKRETDARRRGRYARSAGAQREACSSLTQQLARR